MAADIVKARDTLRCLPGPSGHRAVKRRCRCEHRPFGRRCPVLLSRRGAVPDVRLRLYNCHRCHSLALVCSFCDRGQINCSPICAQLARTLSLRRAGASYRQTWPGKLNSAVRQRRCRDRRRHDVTHQGSQNPPGPATVEVAAVGLTVALIIPEDRQGASDTPGEQQTDTVTASQLLGERFVVACRFCARTGSSFLRRDFLPHPVRKRSTHRPP